MATIDKLMQGRQPGEIWLTNKTYFGESEQVFVPYFKIGNQWHGMVRSVDDGYKRPDWYYNDHPDEPDASESWQLYIAPKKKVKRWLWATQHHDVDYWDICNRYYSEKEINALYDRNLFKWEKLEWSEVEFEE